MIVGCIAPGCPVTVQSGRCGCQAFFSSWSIRRSFSFRFYSRIFNLSLILFATISAILPARVAMTSSSPSARFTHCNISSSAVDFFRSDGVADITQ